MAVNELNAGEKLKAQVFLVTAKRARVTKQDKPYWSLTLADKTGDIDARVWDIPDQSQPQNVINVNDFVVVTGSVESWNESIQIKVEGIYAADESQIKIEDFVPTSVRPPAEMYDELVKRITDEVKTEEIRKLMLAIVQEPVIKTSLLKSPAAKYYHHAWRGGLLEHILSLWGSATAIQGHYAKLNLDILHAGCVLHDIGKTIELEAERAIVYTPMGELVGHVLIGTHMVMTYCNRCKVSSDTKLRILHLIASHHGDDHGATKPQSAEAVAFHYLDNLDAKMAAIETALAGDGTAAKVNVPILKREVYR